MHCGSCDRAAGLPLPRRISPVCDPSLRPQTGLADHEILLPNGPAEHAPIIDPQCTDKKFALPRFVSRLVGRSRAGILRRRLGSTQPRSGLDLRTALRWQRSRDEMTMNHWVCAGVAAIGLLVAAPAATAEGDTEAGQWKSIPCMGCHGIEGYANVYPTYRVPQDWRSASVLPHRSTQGLSRRDEGPQDHERPRPRR